MITVIKSGMLTTVQDLGRYGFAHLGVSPGGAADSYALRIANLLVGNVPNAAALEMTLLGPTLAFEAASTVAVSGARPSSAVPWNEAFQVAAGTTLEFGPLSGGARAYLSVRGGIEVPLVMKSRSTFLPACLAGYRGRRLMTGDRLIVGDGVQGPCRKLVRKIPDPFELPGGAIRVTPSLQSDRFSHAALDCFHHRVFTVTDDSNRSGLRLSGEPILAANGPELLTEGVALGAVQVPPDGQPIILFVDQQTTGGYPKIANVIAADLNRVAQLRPRDKVTFNEISIPQAIELLREKELWFQQAFADV